MITGLLARWRRPPLHPLEQKLLGALAQQLSPEARAVLEKRLALVNRVQRLWSDKEVDLYHMVRGKAFFDPAACFPNTAEARLARVTFTAPGMKHSFRADIWMVSGYLFSLEFNQSPKGLHPDRIVITRVEVLTDPMAPPEPTPRRSLDVAVLTGRLREWAERWPVTDLLEPLSLPERDNLLRQVDAWLPPDYLELVAQTEGMRVGACVIHGLTALRPMPSADANYYVLAEVTDRGVLAVRQGDPQATISFLGFEGEDTQVGPSLRDAVDRELEEMR